MKWEVGARMESAKSFQNYFPISLCSEYCRAKNKSYVKLAIF